MGALTADRPVPPPDPHMSHVRCPTNHGQCATPPGQEPGFVAEAVTESLFWNFVRWMWGGPGAVT